MLKVELFEGLQFEVSGIPSGFVVELGGGHNDAFHAGGFGGEETIE